MTARTATGVTLGLMLGLWGCGEQTPDERGGTPAPPAADYAANAERWIDQEFQPSP